MTKENQVTLGWAGRVTEIYQRLLQIEGERNSLIKELESIRTGTPVMQPLGIFENLPITFVEGASNSTLSLKVGGAGIVQTVRKESLIPTGGTAKKVHDYMAAHPGTPFTPEEVRQALGLEPEGKPMVNTALSRLRRAGVLLRPNSGEYVFPKSEGPQQGGAEEGSQREEEPSSILS